MVSGRLVDFYRGTTTDNRGRSLAELQQLGINELEAIHDYIQWMFPLPEPSAYNPSAPTLSASDIEVFRTEAKLRHKLVMSLDSMLKLYGLLRVGPTGSPSIARSAQFDARAHGWLTPGNHNFLRISRILRSLFLLGEPCYAEAFLKCLEGIYLQYAQVIGERTLRYWRSALNP